MRHVILYGLAYLKIAPELLYIAFYRLCKRVRLNVDLWIILRKKKRLIALKEVVMDKLVPRKSAQHLLVTLHNRRGYRSAEDCKIYWETCAGLSIWTAEGAVAGMGVEFRGNVLCIRQLQGVSGARIPRDLYPWVRIFVTSCMEFVEQEGLEAVRLYRADQSPFYRHPYFPTDTGDFYKEKLRQLQDRMRKQYDGTAEALGFEMHKKYGEWKPKSGIVRSDRGQREVSHE